MKAQHTLFNTFLGKMVDNTDPNSQATQMRKRRFALFSNLLYKIPKPVRILDIGGTQNFWDKIGLTLDHDIEVTLLNLQKQPITKQNFISVIGDATDMREIWDKEFDVVFSNSVIEHVGTRNQQWRMAQEIQRVAKRYFIQTPNYFFPIEPHFLLPAFQWMPISLRALLHSKFNLGWIKKAPDYTQARKNVEFIQLLKKNEFLQMFPSAKLYEEKIFGLTKSFVVYGGWGT